MAATNLLSHTHSLRSIKTQRKRIFLTTNGTNEHECWRYGQRAISRLKANQLEDRLRNPLGLSELAPRIQQTLSVVKRHDNRSRRVGIADSWDQIPASVWLSETIRNSKGPQITETSRKLVSKEGSGTKLAWGKEPDAASRGQELTGTLSVQEPDAIPGTGQTTRTQQQQSCG